jgi:hypothetical protein
VAEQLLARAEAHLRHAVTTARKVRLDAADGTLSAQVAAQLHAAQRPVSDRKLLQELLDPTTPTAALAGTGLSRLMILPSEGQPKPTAARSTARQALALATRQVRAAKAEKAEAKALLAGARDPDSVGGPGAAKLVRACTEAGATQRICAPVPFSQDHQVFDSVVIGRVVHQRWPQIHRVGGWRPYDPSPDHPSGRAVDIMIPDWHTDAGRRLGAEIARYFQQNADAFGISYMIWRQRQWRATDPVGDWNAMSDRGSPTANHMDHVHITVHGGKGRVFQRLLNQAPASPA